MNKILFIILTMMFMFAFTCPAIAQTNPQSGPEAGHKREASAGLKIVDVVLVRPISVVGSTISTAAYLVISPFVFVMGVAEPTARVMVEAPWRFTAFRYMGEFDHYMDERPIMGVYDLTPSGH